MRQNNGLFELAETYAEKIHCLFGKKTVALSGSKVSKQSIPHSFEEVRQYFVALGKPEQAAAFYDHFQSNGWLVSGKAKMKDWQAAARNWVRNSVLFRGFGSAGGTNANQQDKGEELIERQKMKEKLLRAADMQCSPYYNDWERAEFFKKRDEFLGNYKAIFKIWADKLKDDRIVSSLNWEKIYQEHKAIMDTLFRQQSQPVIAMEKTTNAKNGGAK
ncbi:hypothetical protein AGMMS49938_02810 [Fibrobacterales bacterium]|nr:hypothetical protein AGMMS49938_02810 [Fibrobacterales bacterium]